MTADDRPASTEVLPCGCKMGTVVVDGKPVMTFEPHALDCRWYRYFLDEAGRQGKAPTIIDMR